MPSTRRIGLRTTRGPTANTYSRPDQIPAHYSKSKIGHSYSLWLPWDESAALKKRLPWSFVRAESRIRVVMGEPARQLLPGMTATLAGEMPKLAAQGAPVGMPQAQPEIGRVQQASYNAALPQTAASPIPMPRRGA